MLKKLDKGFWYAILITIAFIVSFYWKLLLNINSIYFVSSGDGMQSYFGVYYQVKYGTSFLHFNGMNYPYGENIFFSVNPPLLSIILYPLNKVIDISNYIIGIFNLSILFSLIMSSAFLYLIFCRFINKKWQSILLAILITFINPQILRIGGHYSLAYLFIVPGIIWFLLKYKENPSKKIILYTSIYTFVISTLHLYFFAFSALIWLLFHLYNFITLKNKTSRILILKGLHFFIQVLLPYSIIMLLVRSDNFLTDRTATPWGLLHYNTNLTGLFFPFNKWYEPFFAQFINPANVDWEGKEYLGLFTAISFIYIVLKLFISIFTLNFKKILDPFGEPIISFFAWISFISTLVAFAYPLNTNFGSTVLDHVGLLKQFRGIARFAWITYISASIVGVYFVFKRINNKWLNILCLVILFFDAYQSNYKAQNNYNNKIEEISDKDNSTDNNKWIKSLKVNDYQAILTFPFYTNGSENIYDERGSWCLRYGMITSMKTGLPLYNIHMSRTSRSQAFSNFNLIQEPYRYPEILSKFDNQKKLLLICLENEINSNERDFLSSCTKISSNNEYSFYEVSMVELQERYNNLFEKQEIKSKKYLPLNEAKNVFFNNFEYMNSSKAYYSKGAFSHPVQHYLTFFNDTIPNATSGEYIVSFWVGNFDRDLIPRSNIEIILMDKYGRPYDVLQTNIGKKFVIIDKNWALIESKIVLNNSTDKIKLTVWSDELKTDSNVIDRLLIRPINTNVYENSEGNIILNNRYYSISLK